MSPIEAWAIGAVFAVPVCFAAGYLTSRAARLRAEREEREYERRVRESSRQWPE